MALLQRRAGGLACGVVGVNSCRIRGIYVASPGLANIDPWGRSLIETLRRWWWIPAALAFVGAVVGGVIGGNSPATATALLRVQSTANNGDGLTQAQQSALTETGTSEVFQAAAKQLRSSEGDLRARTELAAVPQSLMISASVTGDSPEAAANATNVFAQAAVAASNARVAADLNSLSEQTSQIIRGSHLNNPQAEQARVAALGQALASSQANTLAQSRQLTVVQPATAAGVKQTSAAVLVVLGAVGGGLVGAGIALLVGGRRGRMGKLAEMRRLYPNVEFLPTRDVAAVLSMETPSPQRVVVTGVRLPAAAVQELVGPVAEGFEALGREVSVTKNMAAYGASQQTPSDPKGPVTVLETGLSTAIVKRVARDPEAVLLVLVRSGKTRFEWLDEYAGQFGERTYIVVEG